MIVITIPILIKLFATRIVASSFFGLSSNLEMINRGVFFSSSLSSISDLVSENKATSAPETKAEQMSSTKSSTKPNITEYSTVTRNAKKLGGSGSNSLGFD